MPYDILVIGRPQVDLIFTGIDTWPEVGRELYASGLLATVGGTFNVAAALQRLNLNVGMVGEVGNDEWSQRSLAAMKEEGVSSSLMSVLDRPLPSLSVCMTHEGDRGFLTYDVPSVEPGLSCSVNVLMAVEREEARFLLCYLGSSVAAYAPTARKRGITVVADCSWDESWLTSAEMKSSLCLTDILIANEPEARTITGESDPIAALHALAEHVPFVVVKQGAKGASAIVDGQEYHAATTPVPVVDATGAGDCFNAGFLYGLYHGYPMDACLRFGNICGGLSVAQPGGYHGAPTEPELLAHARSRSDTSARADQTDRPEATIQADRPSGQTTKRTTPLRKQRSELLEKIVKLLIIGAGIRTPLLLHGLIKRQEALGLSEITLYDADPGRLHTMGAFARHVAAQGGATFTVTAEPDLATAAKGASFVFCAIRVGQERHRIADERVPLQYGVLGQETTGPGGFAMALRTIPVLLDYARILEAVAPAAWFVNFTNPAGLITQALTQQTSLRVVGICDTPTAMRRSVAAFLGHPESDLLIDYAGLNHLGWIRRVLVQGVDVLPTLIDRYEALAAQDHEWALFDPGLIRALGMLPNEYLYYYYSRDTAVANILASGGTRGEQILGINEPLWQALSTHIANGHLDKSVNT